MSSSNGKWMYEYCGAERWSISDEYDTKEDAIRAGKEWAESEALDSFEVGKCVDPTIPGIDGDRIIEDVTEAMYDVVGEVSEDWLQKVKREDVASLEEKLNKVFRQWLKDTGNMPTFFAIEKNMVIALLEGE